MYNTTNIALEFAYCLVTWKKNKAILCVLSDDWAVVGRYRWISGVYVTIEHQQPGKSNMANQGFCMDGATRMHRPRWRSSDPALCLRVRLGTRLALPQCLNTQPEHTEIRVLLFTHCAPLSSNLFLVCSPAIDQQKTHKDIISEKKQLLHLYLGSRETGKAGVLMYMLESVYPSDNLTGLKNSSCVTWREEKVRGSGDLGRAMLHSKTTQNSLISQLEKVPKLASNDANELYEQIAY